MASHRLANWGLGRLILCGAIVVAIIPVAILALGSGLAVKHLVQRYELERTEVLANSLVQQFDDLLRGQANAIAATGSQIGDVDQNNGAAVREALARAQRFFPLSDHLTFAALNGKILGTSDNSDANGGVTNLADRDHFQQTLRTRQPVIDRQVLTSRASGVSFIAIDAPITTPAGDMVGVLIEYVVISKIQKLVDSVHLGTTGYAQLAGVDGQLIVAATADGPKQSTSLKGTALWAQLGASDSGRMTSYVGLSGTERMGAFATIPSTGWKLWVGRDASEIDADIIGTDESAAIWVIGAVALAALIAYLLARGLARPIESLRLLAGQIAAGSFATRAEEAGPREVAELAGTINEMAKAIDAKIEQERAVRARLESAVKQFSDFTAVVAAGDLAVRLEVEGDDELAQLGGGLNAMADSLSAIVREIQGAALSIESAAAEILAATSQQVAATAEEATAVRQTAATVAEVRQTTEVSAHKTRAVAEMAERIEETTADGRRSVAETVQGSEESKRRMETLAERILAFSDQAQEIAEINAAVNELAQKSNLLAVNASIEAAKAGEAGRGFTVVANEIKDLADRSKEATIQVRKIVTDIQKSAQGAVIAVEQSVKMAETGVGVAERSGLAIAALAESVGQASQAARQITAAAEQQEAGMEQINLAMRNIEQSSAQTVAATQQVERAALDLNQLARKLTGLVKTTRTAAA